MTNKKNTANHGNPIPYVAGLLTFVLVFILLALLVKQQYDIFQQARQRELQYAGAIVKQKMLWVREAAAAAEEAVCAALKSTNFEGDFQKLAPPILKLSPTVDAIAVVKGAILTDVYPVKGNEELVGHHIFESEFANADFQGASGKNLIFKGPYELRNGEEILFSTKPIHNGSSFWGLAVAIVKISKLQHFLNDYRSSDERFLFRIYQEKESTDATLNGGDTFIVPNSEIAIIRLAQNNWVIEAKFTTKESFAESPVLLLVLAGVAATISGLAVWWLAMRPLHHKKRAEFNELTLAGVFESSAVGMAIIALNGYFQKTNPAFCRILGYTAAELKEKAIMQITHPDDVPALMTFMRKAIAGTQTNYHNEERRIRKDGSVIWVVFNILLIRDTDGNPLHFVCQIEDITERKRITDQLAEREEQLRLFNEYTPASQVMLDREMRYITMSNRYKAEYNLTHIPSEDLVGTFIYDSWEGFPERWKQVNLRAMQGNIERCDEESYIGTDGQLRWITYEVRPWHQANGEIGGIIVFSEDITKTKEAELRFRALVEKSMVGVYIIQSNTIIYANPRMAEIFGYTVEEMTGMNVGNLMFPEDREELTRILASDGSGQTDTVNFDAQGLTKSGQKIWVKTFGSNFTYKGAPARIGSLIDISLRRNAEAEIKERISQLEAITDNISDVVIYQLKRERSGQRKYLFLSKGIERFTGLSPKESLTQQHNFHKFFHKDDLPRLYAAEDMSFETLTPIQHEFRCFTFTGEELAVTLTAVPRLTDDDAVIWDGIFTDVTGIKRAQQDLQDRNTEIQERVKELNCLYNISRYAADPSLSEIEILQKATDILPTAYRYHGSACARIRYAEMVFYSENFKATEWHLMAYMQVDGHAIGTVEVFYSTPVPEPDAGEDLFLDEEKLLLKSVAEILSGLIERRTAHIELLESEQKFRSLVEQSLVGVVIIHGSRFMYVNAGFENIIGYDRKDLLNKLQIQQVVHEDDIPLLQKLNTVSRTASKPLPVIMKLIRATGEIRYAEIISNPIYYQEKPAAIAIVIDITNRVLEEQRINQAVINAQEQERFQIGMELHDNINQMLTVSNIYLDLTSRRVKDNEAATAMLQQIKDYIANVNAEIRRLSHRLAPALNTQTSLSEKIDSLVKNFDFNKHHIQLDVNIEENKDEPYSEELQLTVYRILQEQCSNILKYAQASLITINLKKTDNKLVLEISDDGQGFDLEARKDGIGLTNIARRAVSLGGKTEIISSPGNGCQVIVNIPLHAKD